MLRFPFVSRDRFEDERKRAERAEAKVESLEQQLLAALRPVPVSPLRTEPLVLTEDTDLSTVLPIQGKPTLASITAQANKAARDRVKAPGSPSIAMELYQEAAKKPVLKAANGD